MVDGGGDPGSPGGLGVPAGTLRERLRFRVEVDDAAGGGVDPSLDDGGPNVGVGAGSGDDGPSSDDGGPGDGVGTGSDGGGVGLEECLGPRSWAMLQVPGTFGLAFKQLVFASNSTFSLTL